MASSKGMASGVSIPTVPSMPTSSSVRPTKGTSVKGGVVKVPKSDLKVKGKVRAPKVKSMPVDHASKMRDAHRLGVPAHKRLREKPFQIPKRKPVL
jgi:hypothetical protein